MPQKGKVTSRSSKKGKSLRKSTRTATYDSESLGQDEPSVHDALCGITTMMATMNSRLDAMEGGNRKKRPVAFRDPTDANASSADEAVPEAASSRSAAPRQVDERGRGTSAASVFPPLPDVSETVRARVAQRLNAPPTPFCISEDECDSDTDSGFSGKRSTVKSGKVRTLDSKVSVRIRWPHEMGDSSVEYHHLSLAAFTDGYLGLLCLEQDTQVSGAMLRHLRAMLQDVDD